MPKIQQLSEEVINQIAAGEVIERPASLVKELVENALDAKASSLIITLEDYGKKLISVQDDGEGMDEVDVERAIVRHATSKITTSSDLQALHTLGFRGEALASIAAVSQLSILSRPAQSIFGVRCVWESGVLRSTTKEAALPGTRIEVRNLFFNTPARKKFLKSESVELSQIMEVISKYAVFCPGVSFRVLHQGRMLLNAPALSDQRQSIAAVYGAAIAKHLVPLKCTQGGLQLEGQISLPHAASSTALQLFAVNGRVIKSQELSQAVEEAYHSLLFTHTLPKVFLQLKVDPQQIDINVHPQKLQVKFSKKEQVMGFVAAAIRQTLESTRLVAEVQPEMQLTFGVPQASAPTKQGYSFVPGQQTVFEQTAEERGAVTLDATQAVPYFAPTEKLPPLKLFGQIHKTFFVAETPGGVIFIDQHAAHERVLYELFLEQQLHIARQTLLQGELLEFSSADIPILQEHQEELRQLGFEIEHFGERTYRVKTIPSVLGRTQAAGLLHELVGEFREKKASLAALQEEILTRMACRSAVMAGEELTVERMQGILRELEKCALPFTCPHGRPTLLKTGYEELEKKFKRRG